jgi:hypothetical protein
VKCWIFGSHKESANFFPFESRSAEGIDLVVSVGRGMEAFLSRIGLGNTDLQFLAYLVILAVVHHQFAQRFESSDYWLTSAPSMLVLFLWLAFMTLAGLANWLDRWRIPTLLVFVLGLTLVLSLRGSTRLLNCFPDKSTNGFVNRVRSVRDRENALLNQSSDPERRRRLIAEESTSLEACAWQGISSRMNKLEQFNSGKGKTLVVVTCPGGGIHAASWASCVLDQLSSEYVEFKDSLCVISGVSGGSVGTLMFVGSRYENELLGQFVAAAPNPSTADVHKTLKEKSPALELAARSSLEAIAFGIAVDDLYNLLGISGVGRGQRLEDSLISRLPTAVQSLTMGQWGDRALTGDVPILVFNSTDAVTGRRILFDTIPTPGRVSSVGSTARPLDYRELLDARVEAVDLLPATAARTSATFPYVSPYTKPSQASKLGEEVAICDGGFVDNEGILTAVNWIEFCLKRWASEKPDRKTFDRILLLRIEPSAVKDKNLPVSSKGFAGMFRWLTGPAETMVNVRNASQLERGNLETDLVALQPIANKKQKETSTGHDQPQLGMWADGTPAQTQSGVEIPEFDKRKLPPNEIRKNWEQMLDRYIAGSDEQKTVPRAYLPKAMLQTGDKAQRNGPVVVVQTITFADGNQMIPLNWKLSNRQKQGYLLAWELCSGEDKPLRETLDLYFNRTGN